MEFTVGRLKWTERLKSFKMMINSGVDYSFKYLRQEIEIGDRAIVGKFIVGEVVFLEKRTDRSYFERFRESAFR